MNRSVIYRGRRISRREHRQRYFILYKSQNRKHYEFEQVHLDTESIQHQNQRTIFHPDQMEASHLVHSFPQAAKERKDCKNCRKGHPTKKLSCAYEPHTEGKCPQ